MRSAKKVPLDLTDNWEEIVNNVERHNARNRWETVKERRRLRKLRHSAINLSLCAVLAVVLSWAKLLSPWVATATAVLLICIASAMVGRLWERRRQWPQ